MTSSNGGYYAVFCGLTNGTCSGKCMHISYEFDDMISPPLTVNDCYNACGANSVCTGQFTSGASYVCSCLSGFVSPAGNGANCISACNSNGQCGSNAYCTATPQGGVCNCNSGYYSIMANGVNCIAAPISCECT